MQSPTLKNISLSYEDFKKEILNDYKIAITSRECSVLGRREVLNGKATFGIFGDGKEVPQIAMAKSFRDGDFRSGYYRDQTFMMAIGKLTPLQYFSALYAHTDIKFDPMSAGRQMNSSFATHSLDDKYNWKDLTLQKNSSADLSPTGSQMPRLLGLGLASKIYRENDTINSNKFSNKGNEVAWGTIGDSATSEGLFFETINAAGVLQVPVIISVWDDNYGISVPSKYQTTKGDISEVLSGFQRDEKNKGYEIIKVMGWDYPSLITTYQRAEEISRSNHVPVLVHVKELTQPLGHSTSGSHERYKSKERLEWESEFDCNSKMREWIIINQISNEKDLKHIEESVKKEVREAAKKAKSLSMSETKKNIENLTDQIKIIFNNSIDPNIAQIVNGLNSIKEPLKRDFFSNTRKILRELIRLKSPKKEILSEWLEDIKSKTQIDYSSHLYSESKFNPIRISEVSPIYHEESKIEDGRIVIRENFDAILKKYDNVLIFGQDSGKIGGVNQGLEGLQEKYGETRVFDTGIREATIIGQGIGLALRGLRPIAEIQYLDYLLYAIQIISDDLATLHYRTRGKQKAPLIIRTRGHRLEGIWHSGSPMGGIINFIRGIYVLVPRNMTKAAGFYNTLLEGDQPALVIECLNKYRSKEKLPDNLGDFKTPIGKVDLILEGSDITIVSYGSSIELVEKAAQELNKFNIKVEIIDCQSLIPFDLNHDIAKSIEKTNRLLIVDEDFSGGASAYILNELISNQNIYNYLDSNPKLLTAKNHRPAYGSDGDYFSKPSMDDIFDVSYNIMHESSPNKFPKKF
ncbi:MAG: transketolase [Flavobacteriaceae bacterium]|jgi:2-oxoisovalerate dehydrogenase E1 component|nr:transketolase [Flavobacteriaceae bacterium]MBT4112475.1 transketolase [Flavobacteriaceae bacterium]MBT4614329.1 transketolase [Flavobacteriaceae bacterium]MBT5246782.1 transketolase [Flavobacteriaceae bacterium]MBT5649967.1 transketolase [Flavobacteriaceae bacterium]